MFSWLSAGAFKVVHVCKSTLVVLLSRMFLECIVSAISDFGNRPIGSASTDDNGSGRRAFLDGDVSAVTFSGLRIPLVGGVGSFIEILCVIGLFVIGHVIYDFFSEEIFFLFFGFSFL